MNPPVPQHQCGTCGEFLPHACAPVVLISRRQFGRKQVTVIDRERPRAGTGGGMTPPGAAGQAAPIEMGPRPGNFPGRGAQSHAEPQAKQEMEASP